MLLILWYVANVSSYKGNDSEGWKLGLWQRYQCRDQRPGVFNWSSHRMSQWSQAYKFIAHQGGWGTTLDCTTFLCIGSLPVCILVFPSQRCHLAWRFFSKCCQQYIHCDTHMFRFQILLKAQDISEHPLNTLRDAYTVQKSFGTASEVSSYSHKAIPHGNRSFGSIWPWQLNWHSGLVPLSCIGPVSL